VKDTILIIEGEDKAGTPSSRLCGDGRISDPGAKGKAEADLRATVGIA
jgi:hypothetical protein